MTTEAKLVEKPTCIHRKKLSVLRNCTVLFKVKELHEIESRTKAHFSFTRLLAINRHLSQLISKEKSESQALNIDSSIRQASSILLIIIDLLSPLLLQNIQLDLDCAICKQATKPGDRVKLSEKGCSGIHSARRERGDNLQVTAGQVVHAKCRKDYTHPNCIAAFKPSAREGTPSPVKKRRSLRSHHVFDFKAQCLFCCQSTEP